jgi:hypothetical protein
MSEHIGVLVNFARRDGTFILQTIDKNIIKEVAPEGLFDGAPVNIRGDEYTIIGFGLYPSTRDLILDEDESEVTEGMTGSYRSSITIQLEGEQS